MMTKEPPIAHSTNPSTHTTNGPCVIQVSNYTQLFKVSATNYNQHLMVNFFHSMCRFLNSKKDLYLFLRGDAVLHFRCFLRCVCVCVCFEMGFAWLKITFTDLIKFEKLREFYFFRKV